MCICARKKFSWFALLISHAKLSRLKCEPIYGNVLWYSLNSQSKCVYLLPRYCLALFSPFTVEVNRVPASLYYYAIFIKNIRTVYRIFSNSFFLGGRGGGRLFNNFSLRGALIRRGAFIWSWVLIRAFTVTLKETHPCDTELHVPVCVL